MAAMVNRRASTPITIQNAREDDRADADETLLVGAAGVAMAPEDELGELFPEDGEAGLVSIVELAPPHVPKAD